MTDSESWTCPRCGAVSDIAGVDFCTPFRCPSCGTETLVHTLLANFKLLSVLGYGGMSTVYRAEDMVLGRTVAIKVLSGAYQDAPESRERFGQECSHMAKVRHDNVVSVYSAGWSAGHFYIAMEVVEGDNLEVLLAQRRFFLPHEALEIIRQVAHGLRAAAKAGVLHRDIKPGNIIITPQGVAKVLDFGLAQDDRFQTEQGGIIWATPFYVPPETLRRSSEDCRSDIYACGMTLRALLTGKDKSDGPAAQDLEELIERKRRMPRFRTLYSKLNETLGDLVDHMTAFEPADRPADYDELLEEIAEVQSVVGKTGLRRLQHRGRRTRRLALVGLGACAAIGLLGAVIAASGGPVYHIYTALPVAAAPRWDEWNAYIGAHRLLDGGQAEEAAECFAELSEKAAEPRIRAAAEQHAELLKRLQAPDSATDDLEKTLLAQCCAERLRAHAEARQRAAQAAKAPQEVAPPAPKPTLAPKEEQWNRTRQALAQGRIAQAQDELRQLARESGLSTRERSEIGVLTELCEVCTPLFDKLSQRCGASFDPAASPERMAEQARVLAPDPFPAEVRCLATLLHGDYQRAMELNPYAADRASREPFAIILRDWKSRLGM